MGKSTGAGSLSLWMHNIQSTDFFDYDGAHYKGPAATIGAGLEGYQLNAIARENGKVFLAGACASVGTVGGYTQGGGAFASL
jgi:FAD/FMN-containing dehydrogenase